MSTFEKADLGISMMIMTESVPPMLNLVNECLDDVTGQEFNDSFAKLITETDWFEIYGENDIAEIKKTDFAIGIIREYLCSVVGGEQISQRQFRKKFNEITKKLRVEMYEEDGGPIAWEEIELTTCGSKGRYGPSLENCIEEYDTEWCRNKEIFNVEENRRGIQQLTVPQSGLYEVSAWGAGNKSDSGSGTVFEIYIFLKYFFSVPVSVVR